jgi:transposase
MDKAVNCQVLQAIFYILVTGRTWRSLPKDFSPPSIVYYYFRQWREDGTWKRIHA